VAQSRGKKGLHAMEPPGSRHGSQVSASPQGPMVSKALTIHTAKLKSEFLYGITVLKENSDIQTLERNAEAGASSRDKDK